MLESLRRTLAELSQREALAAVGAFGPAQRQMTRSLTLRSGGTGLGLAIADRIAAAHQARLTIQSEAGKGKAVEVGFGSDGIGP